MATSCRRLVGKVAIITASTEGIGLAIAERLGHEGASVVVSSRKQANVDAAVRLLEGKGIQVMGMVCHVGKQEHRQQLLEKTVERFGGVDILVSNAGTNPAMGETLETSEAVYDKIMDTNVKSGFLLVKEAVPHIKKRGGGSIVLVSSVGGYQPSELLGIYGVSKTALLGLTKALTPQLARMNIRINCLSPGLIKTKLSTGLWNNPGILDHALQNVPLGRIGQADEMAGVVAFLVSDDASYVTGESIIASGGHVPRL